jgi:hypothetical protein
MTMLMNVVLFAGYSTKKQDNVKILLIYFALALLPRDSYKTCSDGSGFRSARRVRIQTRLLTKCTGTVSMKKNISYPYKFFLKSLGTASGNSKQDEDYQE